MLNYTYQCMSNLQVDFKQKSREVGLARRQNIPGDTDSVMTTGTFLVTNKQRINSKSYHESNSKSERATSKSINTSCKRDEAIKDIKLMRSTIQVKHATSNKNNQNSTAGQNGVEKLCKVIPIVCFFNLFISNTCCTTKEKPFSWWFNDSSRMLLLHVQVCSHGHLNHSGSFNDAAVKTMWKKVTSVRETTVIRKLSAFTAH